MATWLAEPALARFVNTFLRETNMFNQTQKRTIDQRKPHKRKATLVNHMLLIQKPKRTRKSKEDQQKNKQRMKTIQ